MTCSPEAHFAAAREVFSVQQQVLTTALDRLEPSFSKVVECLRSIPGKVVCTGLGKSGIVAHKIAATLASTGTPAIYLNASEALHGDIGLAQLGDAMIMVSASGSTAELFQMLPAVQRLQVPLIGFFGKTRTALAQRCDFVVDVGVNREACPLNLSPMSSTLVAMVAGDALAAALMRAREFAPEDFARFHPGGALGRRLTLRAADVMHTGDSLPVVGPDATFRDVLIELTRPNLGAVCVCGEQGVLQGIITDGDVRRHLLRDAPHERPASALMTPRPKFGTPEQRLNEVLQVLEKHGIYVLPIVTSGTDLRLLGVVRMHDVLGQGEAFVREK
ncbi:MAG: SIS domain-containing protein [Opitutales bacterium]